VTFLGFSFAFFLPYSILSEQPLVDRLLSYRLFFFLVFYYYFRFSFLFEGFSQLAGPEPRPPFFRPFFFAKRCIICLVFWVVCWYNQSSLGRREISFRNFGEPPRKSILGIILGSGPLKDNLPTERPTTRRENGKTYQEPLGPAHRPGSSNL